MGLSAENWSVPFEVRKWPIHGSEGTSEEAMRQLARILLLESD